MNDALVEARLGRAPQDMLEAAVVLEAWAGVPPSRALGEGRALLRSMPRTREASTARLPDRVPRRSVTLEAGAYAASVLAVALWAAPLRAAVGADGLRHALMIALPFALGWQWTLSSRYLSRPGGLAALQHHRGRLALCAVLVVAAPAAALGAPGLLAGLLTVIWTGGAILARRGRALVYAAAAAAATPPLLNGAPALAVLAALAAVIVAAIFVARRTEDARSLGPWDRAVRSGLVGAALGLLLVGDQSVRWTTRPDEALILIPSILAGSWGSTHLLRVVDELPASLVGLRLYARARSPLRLVAGALLRIALACTALSVLVALAIPGSAGSPTGALVGFGLLAAVTVLASLLESLGWAGATLAALCAGLAVEVLMPAPFPGAALVAGSAVAVLALALAVAVRLRHPATLLATTLWIP